MQVIYNILRPEVILDLVQLWRKDKVTFSESESLDYVASLYSKDRNWSRAVTVAQEAIRTAKSQMEMSRAKHNLASIYQQAGDIPKMLSILNELAALSEDEKLDSTQGLVLFYRHDARKKLADYYFDRKEWNDALNYYEKWKYISDCGTGSEEVEKKRVERISECKKQIRIIEQSKRP